MKKRTTIVIACSCAVLAFLAGAWVSYQTRPQPGTRKVLYYVDPMHPSYKSDKPGVAPDCGMQLEPVYADGAVGDGSGGGQLPPGTVQVSAEKLQAIGVKVAAVERASGSRSIRVPGRVVPDERRVYRMTASVDGWVQEIGNVTTGSMVKKHETLLSFYAPDFLAAVQSYIYALSSNDRSIASRGKTAPSQLDANRSSILNYRNSLRNIGMSDVQMDEIAKTRETTENVRVIAPAAGLVLARNVFPGLKFERGTEFYRIADLSKVWLLADTYGSESDGLKPGTSVKVTVPNRNRSYIAKVSNIPPIFDQNSRTLKVRLEVDNPGLLLRPDMFVDVELPLNMPAVLSVPSDALLDSGLKKTVFVELKTGTFEPREVKTGRSYGDRVEILSGLKDGERVVVSGTFLIDSESRMKVSAAGITSTQQQDPICQMYVDEAKTKAAGRVVTSGGTTYYFCSDNCKDEFLKKGKKQAPASAAPAEGKKTVAPAGAMAGHDMGGHEPMPAGAGAKPMGDAKKPAGSEHKHD